MYDIQTIEEIKSQYPEEWILVGNPDLGDPNQLGSLMKKLVSGIVLYHSKDKREVAYKAKDVRNGCPTVTLFYTGEVPKNRKFWL